MHTQPISAGEQPHVQSPESVHVRKQGLYNLTAMVLEVAQHVQEVLWFFPLSFQRQGIQPGFYVGKNDGLTYYVCNNPGNLCYYLVMLPQLHLSKDERPSVAMDALKVIMVKNITPKLQVEKGKDLRGVLICRLPRK